MARRIRLPAVVLLTIAVAVILAACGPGFGPRTGAAPMPSRDAPPRGRGMMMGRGMGPHGGGMMMGGAMQRHRWAMMGGIPAAYRGLRNPLPHDLEIIAAGRALYQAHCASCHGEHGLGDGPAAAGLSPPPANLRWILTRPMAGDDYLMWAISEGGTASGTPMPAFKDALSETDRWKIIRFLGALQ